MWTGERGSQTRMGQTPGVSYRPRTWLLRAWRSPLGRRVDRAEAVAALVAVAVALLVVPLTVVAHKHVRSAQHEAARQSASAYAAGVQPGSSSAGEPYSVSSLQGYQGSVPPRLQPEAPSREATSGDATSAATTSGHSAGADREEDVAVVFADTMTTAAWLLLVSAGYALVRRGMDRRRMAGWDGSWRQLAGARSPR